MKQDIYQLIIKNAEDFPIKVNLFNKEELHKRLHVYVPHTVGDGTLRYSHIKKQFEYSSIAFNSIKVYRRNNLLVNTPLNIKYIIENDLGTSIRTFVSHQDNSIIIDPPLVMNKDGRFELEILPDEAINILFIANGPNDK